MLIDDELAFAAHINMIVAKANRTLGVIKRKFRHLYTESFITLYKVKVRSVLEYASLVWKPHFKKDINKLERVQARAMNMVPMLRNMSIPS